MGVPGDGEGDGDADEGGDEEEVQRVDQDVKR
jgi:hypothetical protein